MGTIEINKIRNIQRLRFEIPDRGVWLLTAGNGGGKTTLLACIRRIGHPMAFPIHFPMSLQSDRLDNHSDGTVDYEINGASVSYAYRGERWTPRPRSNSDLFRKFGYASVIYIGATADRITPRPEDFEPQRVRGAANFIVEAANSIFETDKFSMLRTINLARGVGNDAFVLLVGVNPNIYHSEKNFSLGELCVLKLLRLIKEVSNNSMVIIDELEMALHPRAQIKLLRLLEEQSRAKSLTVIFSTHSVTLLKTIDRRRIIYLEKQDDGEVKPIYGCFPTYAIGNIASNEETLPDIRIYVEDLFARDMSTAFFEQFATEHIPDQAARPTAKIVPVGGFREVVAFLERNRSVLPSHCVQKAVLDADVSNETLAQWRQTNNHAQLTKYEALARQIDFLPFTPEVGLMNYVDENLQLFERNLRAMFADNQLRIRDIVQSYDKTLQGASLRTAAKRSAHELIEYVAVRTQRSNEMVQEQICRAFAQSGWQNYRADFMALFGSMLSHRSRTA
ncbi:AAA family ATPase [Methylocystis suflitae]|uniref:AAA family ATPase n=1 Tax=Methylocystis suflitae TaxID=2951405 RepID=UPI00210B511B|nr:AAA family ATPase [Methylocystis suflitae]MCQ4190035.1 AAA family ATPase [Methylocystis suflitae]